MTTVQTQSASLREEFGSLARFLTVLSGFTAVSLFAEGVYRPLKRLGAGLYKRDDSAMWVFHEALMPLLPALVLLGALWQARQLFRHLESGETLSVKTGTGLRNVSEWIIAAAITGLIVGEATVGARPGWALLAGLAAIGLALRSLSRVIDHAAAIKADHDQIV